MPVPKHKAQSSEPYNPALVNSRTVAGSVVGVFNIFGVPAGLFAQGMPGQLLH